MERRSFIQSVGLGAAALTSAARPTFSTSAAAATPPMKITRIRFYHNPHSAVNYNYSSHIVTVETDQGITGIGEGGSKDMIEPLAGMIMGEDAGRISQLWQMMFCGTFYPSGRERLHALGAIDLALWDIKGKALGVPVYDLLGGFARDHVECYASGFADQGSLKATARACMEAGFRAIRYSIPPAPQVFNSHIMVRGAYDDCVQLREGVGKDGDWILDCHDLLDMADAIRLGTFLEPLEPFYFEDPLPSENPDGYLELRQHIKVPIAMGEQLGTRWDINRLVERQVINYARVTLPNVGGITEYLRIMALCGTHFVAMAPHFTGSVSEAALVHCLGTFPGELIMEMNDSGHRVEPHLPQHFDFRNGKLWPNRRPGLGVELDTKPLQLVAEFTERVRPQIVNTRPDGSVVRGVHAAH